MKRLLILLTLFLFILLSGCSSADNILSDEPLPIPETLVVNADFPDHIPAKASVYKVSYKTMDSDSLLNNFQMNPDSFREKDAIGKRYEKGNGVLYILDDTGALCGGFTYSDISVHSNPILDAAGEMGAMATEEGSDTEAEALSLLQDIGLDQMKVDQVHTLTGAALNEFVKTSGDEYVNEFADQNEIIYDPAVQYAVIGLSQMVDDIPFIAFPWGTGSNQTYTESNMILSEGRMVEARFVQMYEIGSKIKKDKVISPQAALNVFINDYNQSIHTETTTITNITLNYVVTFDADGMYAQPAYVFSIGTELPQNTDESMVISALNGELILSTEAGI